MLALSFSRVAAARRIPISYACPGTGFEIPIVGPAFQPVTGVSTFSGVGGLDQVCSAELNAELFEQFRVFGSFFAQEGH
jgi:hypothetical protein